MNIVFFKDYMRAGRGAEAAVSDTAALLAADGHETHLATCQSVDEPLSFPPPAAVRVVRTGTGDAFDDINSLQPDAVISAGTNETLALAAGMRRRGLVRFPWPVVHQCHTYPPTMFKWRHPVRNAAIREAVALVEAVQVLQPSFIDPLRESARIRASKTVVAIGNALPGRIPAAPEGGAENLILYPAAFSKSKRIDLLVRAFAIAAKDRLGWRLAVCGDGKKKVRARIEAFAEKLAPGKTEFPGYVKNLSEYISRAAFIAFPSASEGLPMTLVEGMAAGKPVVGCRGVPGVDGLVRDGLNGILSQANPHAFADALGRMMDGAALRARLGGAAAEFVATRYSREIVLGQWNELLESL